MKRKIELLLAFLLLSISCAFAQKLTVKGTVLDETGQSIIGATVREKGVATNGAQTDIDGRFTLTVKQGATIVVSYVGYKTQEVKAAAQLTIKMVPDNELLDEVVVVGYGTSTKRAFTGSAVTVSGEALKNKSVSNLSQALAGEVPGVTVVNTNGQPGSVSSIYVRGVGSVNASTAPLYVVDGVPYSGDVSAINPADIESTTLLKDAASTAIYGARGANGVILINTKSGKAGQLKVSGDFKYGFNTDRFIPRHSVLTDPDEYMEMGWSGIQMMAANLGLADPAAAATKNIFGKSGVYPGYNYFDEKDPAKIFDEKGNIRPGVKRKYTPENWRDYAFQPSTRMESNIQLGGGTNTLRTFASFGYLNDRGITKNSDFTRYSARMNADFNPTSWIQVKGNLAYTHSVTNAAGQTSYSSTNIFTFIDKMPPIYPVFLRDEKGNVIPSPYYKGMNEFDFGAKRGFASQANGIATATLNPSISKSNQITYGGSATLRLMEGLTFENTYSGNYINDFSVDKGDVWYGPDREKGGTIEHQYQYARSANFLSLLRYNKEIASGHNLEAFVAHEAHRYDYMADWVRKEKLVDPFSFDLSNAIVGKTPGGGYSEGYRMESYFAQANYDFMEKYFVSGTFRYDGSSRFLNKKWGPFGSIGLAWVVSDEDFMKEAGAVSFLKLKASYGSLGQQGGISYYSGEDIYSITNMSGEPSMKFKEKGNPDLTWERSNMAQLGIELGLWDKLSVNVELYDKRTSDLIYTRRVAPSNGYALYNVNDGLLENYGLDLDLTWKAVKTQDFYLTLRANAGFVGNRMLRLPLDPSTGERKFFDESISPYGREEGRSLYDYYMRDFVGVDPDTGLSLYKVYYIDKDGKDGFFEGYTDPKNPANSKEPDQYISSLVTFKHDHPELVGQIKEGTTTKYNQATKYHVGKSALPVVRGGFNISAGYKGLDVSLQFIYGLGGYGYDGVYASLMDNAKVGTTNWHVDMRDRWLTKGQKTSVPRLNNGLDSEVTSLSTRFLTPSSFLNFANFRVGYTLPKSWTETISLSQVKLWVSGDNLFLLSARKGYNPASSLTGGTSSYRYNPLSTITGGVSVTF